MFYLLCRCVLSFTSRWQFSVDLLSGGNWAWLICRPAKFLFEVAVLALGVGCVEGTAEFGLRVVL